MTQTRKHRLIRTTYGAVSAALVLTTMVVFPQATFVALAASVVGALASFGGK